ncbi:MAG: hypothetical protein R3C56_16095 [Pirellulaceae bacterium]
MLRVEIWNKHLSLTSKPLKVRSSPQVPRLTPATLPANTDTSSAPPANLFRLQQALAYSHRESLEILRDPVRLRFAFIGSALLMLVFGFGITMDVNKIDFAVLDQDRSQKVAITSVP